MRYHRTTARGALLLILLTALSLAAASASPAGNDPPSPALGHEPIVFGVPEAALLDQSVATQIAAPTRRALSSRSASRLIVFTLPARVTRDVLTGSPGALSVDRVRLG